MQREDLIGMMAKLLQDTLAEQSTDQIIQASPSSPLIGAEAVLTSMGLVSFVADVETTLAQSYSVELILVSEQALSRKNSPFRTVDTLVDYVLELVGAAVENGAVVTT